MLQLHPFLGYSPYVLLPCCEEVQGKVALFCQGCAAGHSTICSVSTQECNALMTSLISKWTKLVTDFLAYFLHQWMVSGSFGSLKVYCSEPGKDVLNHILYLIFK
jgi:hypothetical protein